MIDDIWCFACNYERNVAGIKFNDMYTIDNNIAIVQGLDCMRQLCAQALWLWYGEWVMDNKLGVTYRRILGKMGNQQSLVSYQIKNAITAINTYIPDKYLAKYGVKKVIVNSYNLDRTNKQLSINVNIILNSNNEVQIII